MNEGRALPDAANDGAREVSERGDMDYLVRYHFEAESPIDVDPQQYSLDLSIDEFASNGGDMSTVNETSTEEIEQNAELILEEKKVDETTLSEHVGTNNDVSAHAGDESWSGVLTMTDSQACGTLAQTEANVNWIQYDDPMLGEYVSYQDHMNNTWSVDGADCNFPDYDIFTTTWHVDDSDSDGGGQMSAYATTEATYSNDDFPMAYGTTYADNFANVDVSVGGTVNYTTDIDHYGTLASSVLSSSTLTW